MIRTLGGVALACALYAPALGQQASGEIAICAFTLLPAPADSPLAGRAALTGACQVTNDIAYQTVVSRPFAPGDAKATGRMRAIYEAYAAAKNEPVEVELEIEANAPLGTPSAPIGCNLMERRVIVCTK